METSHQRHPTGISCRTYPLLANSIIGTIRCTFNFMDDSTFKILFTADVRSHLEYAGQIWFLYLRKDIEVIENVQLRARRMLFGMKDLDYPARLRRQSPNNCLQKNQRHHDRETFKMFNTYNTESSPQLILSTSKLILSTSHHMIIWNKLN